jgi:hypothetical protein
MRQQKHRMARSHWGIVTLVAVCAAAWGALSYLGRTRGATGAERRRALPGDELVPRASVVTDHAIDIEAPAERVWQWLLQLGWHRGGWYTHRWVDRVLFPANAPSTDEILAECQQLAVGDRIPDGPPGSGCFFTVIELEPARALVLLSQTHLPPQLLNQPGVRLNFSWVFVLEPMGRYRTRFHFRSRAAIEPGWLRLAYQLLLVPADFVMGRSMCRGLKERAERRA